jgi:hypothetical protein
LGLRGAALADQAVAMTTQHNSKSRDLTDPPTPPVAAADKPASKAPGEPFKGEVSRTDSPGAGVSAARDGNSAQEKARSDPNAHKGAVEGDRADDAQHSNRNANQHAATLTRDGGPPAGSTAVAHDRVGANADDPEVANADETGRTNDVPRDEQGPRD